MTMNQQNKKMKVSYHDSSASKENTTKQYLETKDLRSKDDLQSLRTRDPFMYYSIPGKRRG